MICKPCAQAADASREHQPCATPGCACQRRAPKRRWTRRDAWKPGARIVTPDGSGQVISNGNGWAFPVDAVLVQLDRDGTCSHFRADDLQEQR